MALGAMFLLAALHGAGPLGRRAWALPIGVVALAGAGVAGRHLWLQALPPERVPACGPGLDFMLEAFPLTEVLDTVLRGSGECATVDWRFLGLAMPAWVLLALATLGVSGVAINLLAGRRRT
jgi:disulfide bond formation protein DsbB